MQSLTFYIVDVFAEEKYAGNQLAVIRNGESLSSSKMQRIANELHFSETTFIMSDKQRQGGYDVRIFTPQKELRFAGHPTLGTAFVIWKELAEAKADKIVLNLKVGQITVQCGTVGEKAEICWMKQVEPIFGQAFQADTVSKLLRIKSEDIDKRFPIQEVSTGVFFMIVPLKNFFTQKGKCFKGRIQPFDRKLPGQSHTRILSRDAQQEE